MNIDYLDMVFSACFSLRCIHSLRVLQRNGREYNMRPQIHAMVVSPFGTGKSSITKGMKNTHPKSIKVEDNFTRAGMEGTITKDGDYVPALVTSLGGKVLIIDEWNNLDFFAQTALLSTLENQTLNRTIGFKVKKTYTYRNKFGYFTIKDNMIEGQMNFACIAYAMQYPMMKEEQKAKALLSRFSPLFIEPTQEMIEAISAGDFIINIEDYGGKVENIVIAQEVYANVHKQYFAYLKEHGLIPRDTHEYGYMTRALSELIRFGIYNYLKQEKPEGKDVLIDKDIYFMDMMKFVNVLMRQFMDPRTHGKIYQFKQLIRQCPGQCVEFYAQRLGVSDETIKEFMNDGIQKD